jgi:hypothetical protein
MFPDIAKDPPLQFLPVNKSLTIFPQQIVKTLELFHHLSSSFFVDSAAPDSLGPRGGNFLGVYRVFREKLWVLLVFSKKL